MNHQKNLKKEVCINDNFFKANHCGYSLSGQKSKKRKSLDWDDDEDKELLLQREAVRTIKLDQVIITFFLIEY